MSHSQARARLGFTLVEIAIALVIVGLLVGLGASLIGPLTKRAKLEENREILKKAYESVLGYAIQNKRLPSDLQSAGAPTKDVFGIDLTYVPANEWTGSNICTSSASLLTINDASAGGTANVYSNVAFIIIANGENRCNQTGSTLPFYVYPQGATGNCCPPNPPIQSCPASPDYDDLVVYIDANNLRQKICSTFRIVTETLPSGKQYVPYPSVKLEATDGTSPYTWSILSGGLPDGMSLDASGNLSGTPDQSGTFPIMVSVTDSESRTATKSLSLTIEPNLPRITTEFLPMGYVNMPFPHAELSAAGGSSGYSWQALDTLPPGLSLNGALIEGIPTQPGTWSVRFQVTDSKGNTDTKALSITIYPQSATSLTLSPPSGTSWSATAGQNFNANVTVSGGMPPYTNIQCSPQSCGGLTLSCSLTGATISGSFSGASCAFSVGWSDSQGQTVVGTYYISAQQTCPVFAINPPSTSWNVTVGQSFTQQIDLSGGQPPYSNTSCSPANCKGLQLTCGSNAATISGTPDSVGSCTFQAGWRDSCPQGAQSISGTYNVNIGCPPLTGFSRNLPNTLLICTHYSGSLSVLGGVGPYRWSIASGSLPPGLNFCSTNTSATCNISGRTSRAGTYNFSVNVTDTGCNQSITSDIFTLTVMPIGGGSITIMKDVSGRVGYNTTSSQSACIDFYQSVDVRPGETISFYNSVPCKNQPSCTYSFSQLSALDSNGDCQLSLTAINANSCTISDY